MQDMNVQNRQSVVDSSTDLEEVVPRGSSNGAIVIDKVDKWFGGSRGVHVLDRVSATVADCEFVSLLGPSGCGKSTLLRVMAGLESHDNGRVEVLGRAVESPGEDVGMVFQTHNLLPWRNVLGNLALGVERRMSREATVPLVAAMIETLGLSGFEQRFPHELSGGMRQRVAIGQALIRNPRILLMDEPFGALDALTRDRLNLELLRIWQAERKTVVLVTHSVVEAVVLSDRVLVMSDRPSRVIESVDIDLPRPRDPRSIREMPQFGACVMKLNRIMGL